MADAPTSGDEPNARTSEAPRASKRSGSRKQSSRSGGRAAGPARKKGDTGKRYSVDERTKITQFIAGYNAEHGRGGITAASKQFGVSVPTLTSWLRHSSLTDLSGRSSGGSPGRAAVSAERLAVLQRMTSIHGQILRLEQEFERLRRTL